MGIPPFPGCFCPASLMVSGDTLRGSAPSSRDAEAAAATRGGGLLSHLAKNRLFYSGMWRLWNESPVTRHGPAVIYLSVRQGCHPQHPGGCAAVGLPTAPPAFADNTAGFARGPARSRSQPGRCLFHHPPGFTGASDRTGDATTDLQFTRGPRGEARGGLRR